MSNLADQLKRQSQKRQADDRKPEERPASARPTAGSDQAASTGPTPSTPAPSDDGYRPNVKKLSAELPADEFKWVRVTAAQNDTNATAIVRGLLLLARKDPKILNAALDQLR